MRRDQAHPAGGAAAAAAPLVGQYEFQLLGPFTVRREGQRLPDQAIGSRKARTLLKRLLVERHRVVSVDALAEAVWPQHLPAAPERHVATLVSRVRATLGAAVVVREGGGYRFGRDHPAYLVDVDQAECLVSEAEARLAAGEPGPARTATDRALELLARGEVLADDLSAQWAEPARTGAAALLRRARRAAWAAASALGDPAAAVRVAGAALADEPYDEEACRALMRAHLDRGEVGLALAAYQRLRETLAEELGADPAAETAALHLAILRAGAGAESGPAAPPEPDQVHEGAAGPGERLVGREAEVAALRRVWSQASAGTPALVLLVGEAGIGKTRLAAEAVATAVSTGATVARARCYESERSLFLQPVVEALRQVVVVSRPELVRTAAGEYAGSLAELIAEVAHAAPAPAYQRASPEVERRRLFEAVAGFVRGLAGHRPLLLFLDDLHQAGSSTLELLHFLVRRVAGRRVLVLATVRVEESAEVVDTLGEVATRHDVGPLSGAAVQELARRGGVADLADRLMSLTRGHTLSVVETLRALREHPAEPGRVHLPESLRAAVQARMRRAGPQIEELLRSAAIVRGSFDPPLLAGLLDQPVAEVTRWADAASRARLLVEVGSGYEFANDLIGEIAYETTPLPLRIAGHRRAAGLLTGSPEAVAGHASRAGDWPAALAAYLAAAQAAFQRYAHRDAERLLERALVAAVRADDQTGVAQARLLRGRVREALADYHGTFEDLSAVVALARSLRRRDLELAALRELGGDPLVGTGRPSSDCIPYLDLALGVAELTGDLPAQVAILGRLAVLWTNRLRFDLAGSYARRATALADPGHGPQVQALALDAVKTTLAYRGDVAGLADLLPRLREVVPHLDQRYRVWVEFESAFPAVARGQWARAAARIDHALTLTRQSGYPAYQTPFLAQLSWVERARGQYGRAVTLGRRAAEIGDDTGHPWWMALSGAVLGWTLTEVGALDEAITRLAAGLVAAERDATEGYLLRCLGQLAWASLRRGEPERAAGYADRAESVLRLITGGQYLHGAHATLALAVTRIGLGQPEAAGALLEPLRAAAEQAGWVETVAWADLLRARCAPDRRRAAELAHEAVARAERVDLPGLAWQAYALLSGVTPGEAAAAHRGAAERIVARLAASLDQDLAAGFRAQAAADLATLGGGVAAGGQAGSVRAGRDRRSAT